MPNLDQHTLDQAIAVFTWLPEADRSIIRQFERDIATKGSLTPHQRKWLNSILSKGWALSLANKGRDKSCTGSGL